MNKHTIYVSESLLNELESACKAELNKPLPVNAAEMVALRGRMDALLVSVNSVRSEPVETWCATANGELILWFQVGKAPAYFEPMGSA